MTDEQLASTVGPLIESGLWDLIIMISAYADLMKKVLYQGHNLDIVEARKMISEIGRLQRAALAWINLQSGACDLESEVEP